MLPLLVDASSILRLPQLYMHKPALAMPHSGNTPPYKQTRMILAIAQNVRHLTLVVMHPSLLHHVLNGMLHTPSLTHLGESNHLIGHWSDWHTWE